MQQKRVEYWAKIREVDPDKLGFIEETEFWVGMSHSVARTLRGHKAYDLRKFYRGKKVTVLGVIRRTEVVATQILEGSMKGDDFEALIKNELGPKLKAGEVVVMDNLNAHPWPEVVELIESVGTSVVYLPVYSPAFNPIEMMGSEMKSFVRLFRTRGIESLNGIIKVAITLIHPGFLHNWFTKCRYCTD